ncbi:MAG: MATE family efflux transporter [Clostridiales bacterium]|nr:MAG: MATE family efflux transporter [Clostridiales bacterium]
MKNDYLVQRKPLMALLIFALPMIAGNLFQQTYTMADSAIVGQFVGERALAAVGASYALTNIFICVAIGGGIGASVIVSRYFGAKAYTKMKLAVLTALLSFLAVSIVLGGAGLLLCGDIMVLLNTPADVLGMAVEYLNIYFIGLPFLFMYNVISSMFNALGKSRIPLYFLIFSSVFNVALDFVLVRNFQMGVTGVAWATLIAQGISAVLSFAVFLKELKKLQCGHTKAFSRAELMAMTKIALPSILQQSTVSIGMMLVQSVVNGFGSQVLAGFSAAMRVEAIYSVPMAAIGNALSSYTAQNIGAGRQERVAAGYHAANGMVFVCAAVTCIVLECFSREIVSMFLGKNGTAAAMAVGEGYLTFIGWFAGLLGFKMAVDGVLRGAGDVKLFTVANLVNLFIRVFLSVMLAPEFGIAVIWYAVPLGWTANWIISFSQYRTGKWRRIYCSEGAKRNIKTAE